MGGVCYLDLVALVVAAACLTCPTAGHGCLTRAAANGQVAVAVNARDPGAPNSGQTHKFRELIARSGNDGVCANPPGCEASFKCDWCGLEKVANFGGQLPGGPWWSGTPAAHWDSPNVQPQVACMSKEAFGAGGTMAVAAGDTIATTLYVNADHSGIYRFELGCGAAAGNADFSAAPLTAWKALHRTKELKPGLDLGAGREVGTTRAETDRYYTQQTSCTGAACTYRMNRGAANPDSGACQGDRADCFVDDVVAIPADTACRGAATLRWFWLSAEGPEVYANCLDLNIAAPSGNPGGGDNGDGAGGEEGGDRPDGGRGSAPPPGDNAPTPSGDSGGLGGGWVALICVGSAVGLYVALGVGYNYRSTGSLAHPHRAQWGAFGRSVAGLCGSGGSGGGAEGGAVSLSASGGQATKGQQFQRIPAAAGKKAAAPLPPPPRGWDAIVDPASGDTYYHNAASGETTWDRPGGPAASV